VGQDRSSAGAPDPFNCLSQGRPDRSDVPYPSCAEITVKSVIRVASVLSFDQEAGKMAAADCGAISGVSRCALQAACYTRGIELLGDAIRAFTSGAADRSQSFHQDCRLHVDIQTDDVNCLIVPGGGDFHAGDKDDIETACSLGRFCQTTGFVMISQGEQPDTSGYCAED